MASGCAARKALGGTVDMLLSSEYNWPQGITETVKMRSVECRVETVNVILGGAESRR